MGAPENKFVELERLLSRLHDQIASEVEIKRIESILDGDPEACEFYLDYTQMCADTELEVGTRQAVEITKNGVRESIAQSTALFFEGQSTKQILVPSWRPLPWIAAAAAVVLVGVSAFFVLGKKNPLGAGDAVAAEETALVTDEGVAIAMERVGAIFGEGGLQPKANGILPLGELRLESGIAEIEFYSGARLILEGPAVFEIDSENSCILSDGRLRAHVPPQAAGFTVTTPQIEIVDRGTEFAVSIDEDGHRTEVHCFEGELDVFAVGETPRDPKSLRKLTAEQALRIEPNGSRKLDADPMSFVSFADLAQTSLEHAAMRHEAWRGLIEEMRADDSILALYSFEDQGPRERSLVNQAAYMDQFSHGAIVGCRWTSGRWPSKGALEFNRPSDRVRVHAASPQETLTLAAWVRLDALPRRNSTLLASSKTAPGTAEWIITRDGKLSLAVRDASNKKVHRFQSGTVSNSAHLGEWHHLATVFDKASGEVIHYADGNELSRHKLPKKSEQLMIDLSEAELGNFGGKAANGSRPVRNLTGRIDEFAAFGRALAPEELRKFYEIGKTR